MSSDSDFPPQSRKRGWAGEEMEMAHQREKIRETSTENGSGSEPTKGASAKYSTVNLDQFRNREVGQGYQARGVIRQRTGISSSSAMPILDMTKKKSLIDDENGRPMKDDERIAEKEADDGKEKKKKKKHHRNSSSKRNESSVQSSQKVSKITERYIAEKGIREFRKELHKILSEAQKTNMRH